MRKLEVHYSRAPEDVLHVGTLAENKGRIYFEYASEFLETRLELSPFKLPAGSGLIENREGNFGPLPGLFDDSLPDGWGMLLMDRAFRQRGIDLHRVTPLDRLAYVGTRAMGALTFHPSEAIDVDDSSLLDLRALGDASLKVLRGNTQDVFPELLRAGGSAGGARPKVLIGLSGDDVISGADDLPAGFDAWIVKFNASADQHHAGRHEFAYARMAAASGIDIPEVRLFDVGPRHTYFGVKRFDRLSGNRRVHVHSFAGLLHSNFRIPSNDYDDLIKVTEILTRSHEDVLRAARQMVFNVAAHNRDDHAKNFAFVMNAPGAWSLSPAYDLTHSEGMGGQHTMSVAGESAEPSRVHVLKVAEQRGIAMADMRLIIDAVNEAIGWWKRFADEAGLPAKLRNEIGRSLRRI